jgi:3',5'-cyclic-AMP phosphodiesterase
MFAEQFSEGKTYSSFDHNGWHFILLDSIIPAGKSWMGRVDDTQMQWLKDDLAATGERPVIVTTHMPLVTAFIQFDKASTLPSPSQLICENGKEVIDLFKGHNVKLVLQGHTHILEKIDYAGTTYLTAGSVCGEWWKGPRLGVHPEGFTIVDVNADSVSTKYVPYGWHARVTRSVPLAI